MIGEMRNRVTLKKYITTQDEGGGNVHELDENYAVWAKVEDKRGSSSFNKQQEWNYDYKVTIRNRNIDESYIVEYNDLQLAIKSLSVQEEGRKRFLILRCNVSV